MADRQPLYIAAGLGTEMAATDRATLAGLLAPGILTLEPAAASPIQATVAGNARGDYATDFQTSRSVDTEVASGFGSTISGGLNNGATGTYDTVGGGVGNVTATSDRATIAGGSGNSITQGRRSTIGGGLTNTIVGTNTNLAQYSAIFGGTANTVTDSQYAFIGGGNSNDIASTSAYAMIGGGTDNDIVSSTAGVIGGGSGNGVASSNYGTIGGGLNNDCTGIASTVAGGSGNAVSTNDYGTIGGGLNNLVDTVYGVIPGGRNNNVTGDYGYATGRECNATGPYTRASGYQAESTQHGQRSFAAGRFAVDGDVQETYIMQRRATTDATPRALLVDGSGINITMPDNACWVVSVLVSAMRDDGTEAAGYKFEGVIRKDGSANPVIVGTITKTVLGEDVAGWDAALNISAANPRILVTGAASTNIRWNSNWRINQVVGG